MNPFFFGDSSRQLFGVHAPARGIDRGAVILCYPFAGEYMRAHRAYRQLTNLLTRSGFQVLRFDYSGTGDSAGDLESASIDAWLEDIDAAIEELKDATGAERVSLSGLRLGATLSAIAAVGRKDVERVVLWDPIVVGALYAEELQDAGAAGASESVLGVAGFPVHRGLLEAISRLDLHDVLSGLPHADLVVSEDGPEYQRLRESLAAHQDHSRFLLRPSPNHWMEGDAFGSALIPGAIIEGVLHCLTEEKVR